MIPDHKTNFVYLADTLGQKYPAFYRLLTQAFDAHGVPYQILEGTKDIWAVDYMPVQVSEKKYVQFTYNPDYLQTDKWRKTISDVDMLCRQIGIAPVKSGLVVDGGNVCRWDDKVLMTTKVFLENPKLGEMEVIRQLEDLLEVKQLVFVPIELEDITGHADGMARFLSPNKVLVNEWETDWGKNAKDKQRKYQQNHTDFLASLYSAGLVWEELPCAMYDNSNTDSAKGLYLNYLELEGLIFLPTFGLEKDEQAIARAKAVFPDKTVVPIPSADICGEGGVINCATWNVKKA